MSGQSLFNRVLVEKERASGRQELLNSCVLLASSFLIASFGYSTLTYMAALPALSRNPADSGPLDQTTSALDEPENGVKLLLSIFSRLGSGTQIAMANEGMSRWNYAPNVWGSKAKRGRGMEKSASSDMEVSQSHVAAESQFNQGLAQNSSPDPALSIRPQLNKRASLDDFSQNSAGQQTIAQTAPASPQAMQYAASNSGVGSKVLSENPYIREFAQNTKAEPVGDLKSKIASRRQVNIVDEPMGRARAEHANLIEHSKELAAASANTDGVTGIIRPSEQPGLFKYVREYYKDSLKNMPPPASTPAGAPPGEALAGAGGAAAGGVVNGAPVPLPQIVDASPAVRDFRSKEDNEAARKPSWSASNGGKGVSLSFEADKQQGQGFVVSDFKGLKKKSATRMQTAFLPPNAVHGIDGLSLGATITETNTFLKGRGKVSKVMISGFQILTLRSASGITRLQAFLRDGRLDALRVFDHTFVPVALGVNLGEELPSMKAKFGEPAFILEEPRPKITAPTVVAKNYVYPISQVSFQLSRPNASSAPQVLSMLLFKFL